MRLKVGNEFQQIKIKDLNDLNNVEMFTTSAGGGKEFVAEQKIRELKTRISKINAQKLKISPSKIMEASTVFSDFLNLQKITKYGLSPEEIEHRSL